MKYRMFIVCIFCFFILLCDVFVNSTLYYFIWRVHMQESLEKKWYSSVLWLLLTCWPISRFYIFVKLEFGSWIINLWERIKEDKRSVAVLLFLNFARPFYVFFTFIGNSNFGATLLYLKYVWHIPHWYCFRNLLLTDVEVPAACIILIGLFALQHFGTHRVGFLFAPIVMAWLFCISAIGIYNIFFWNPQIYHALCPIYALRFIRKTQTGGWMALGGVLLSITGLYVWLKANLYFMPLFSPFLFHIYRIRSHVCWSRALLAIINPGILYLKFGLFNRV
jgi:hypothetical protein